MQKLEWESLTVDLLPPKDVYTRSQEREDPNWDAHEERTWRGERLFDKVSGAAYVSTSVGLVSPYFDTTWVYSMRVFYFILFYFNNQWEKGI
jgi:hypothetical protein